MKARKSKKTGIINIISCIMLAVFISAGFFYGNGFMEVLASDIDMTVKEQDSSAENAEKADKESAYEDEAFTFNEDEAGSEGENEMIAKDEKGPGPDEMTDEKFEAGTENKSEEDAEDKNNADMRNETVDSEDEEEASAAEQPEDEIGALADIKDDTTKGSDGEATETATAGKNSIKKASKSNSAVKIKTIKMEKTSVSIATKSNLQLKVILSPENADKDNIEWKSSNEKVATVDQNGNVRALTYGKAVITASSKDDSAIKAVCQVQTRYHDVNDSKKYYYTPVYWAADKQITRGYEDIFFGPARSCTRREFSIFLWRYAGKPAAYGDTPFKDVSYDVSTDSYKAILWCYKNGIIKGFPDGNFKPDAAVNRKDTLIMLYRFAGKPFVPGTVKFADVLKQGYKKGSDTYSAINWGTQLKVTNGYSDGSFKPLNDCLREHIVTFIYRYEKYKHNSVNTMTTERYIWDFLKGWLGNNGAAGLMGNLYVESGLRGDNLEDYFNVKFKVTDTTYTNQVDQGKRDFIDSAGYGLAQWTWYTRKQALLDYAKAHKTSVGDIEMQLDYLKEDMEQNYRTLTNTMKNAKNVKAASDAFMLTYERPYDQSESARNVRAKYGQNFYDKYAK